MKTAFERISMLLASSNMALREITDFARALEEMSPRDFARYIEGLRESVGLLPHELRYLYEPSKKLHPAPSGAIEKINRLLVLEAGLQKSRAMEELAEAVHKRRPEVEIPHDSRKGFTSWLVKLTEAVPESELLFLATTIRNRYVHQVPTDWRLK